MDKKSKEKPEFMTLHYADILKKVTRREWENLRGWEKDYIAGGVEPLAGQFAKYVKEKTTSIYNDGDHSLNNIERFQPELPVLNWQY